MNTKLLAAAALAGIATPLLAQSYPVAQLEGEPYIHDPSTIAQSDGRFYTFGTGKGGLVSSDGWTWKSGPFRPGGGVSLVRDAGALAGAGLNPDLGAFLDICLYRVRAGRYATLPNLSFRGDRDFHEPALLVSLPLRQSINRRSQASRPTISNCRPP